jgi:Tfp pilus assembly protein FimT
MQLIRKLLFRNRTQSGRNHKIRGLSTAELVGIIVIVGILGALGGTYITGLTTAAKNNTGKQNAQSLTTVLTSAVAAGVTCSVGASGANTVDTTSSATAIPLLNTGVTDANGVTYKVNPTIAAGSIASYVLDPVTNSFTFTPGGTP